jgi:hypothetical protein
MIQLRSVHGVLEKIKESKRKQKYIVLRIWRSKRDKRDYPKTEIQHFECLPEELEKKMKPPADKNKDIRNGATAELILIGPGHVIEQLRQ